MSPVEDSRRVPVREPVEQQKPRGMRRRGAHQEMTAKENAEIQASLTPRGWGSLTVAELRAERAESLEDVPARYSGLYIVGVTPQGPLTPRMVAHLRRFVGIARRTSPSINGDFRRDFVEAVRAAPPRGVFGVGLAPQAPAAPAEAPRDPLRGPDSS